MQCQQNPLFYFRLFRYLSSIKHCKVYEHATTSMDKFMELGLVTLFKAFWTEHVQIYTQPNDWSSIPKDTIEALYHLSMALWFISANPKHMLSLFEELCEFLISIISSGLFKKTNENKRVADILKAFLGMLYQFAKSIDKTKEVLRSGGGLGHIQRIGSNRSGFNRNIKGRSLMILAYILNETEQRQMKISESMISFLLHLLQECLNQEDHRSLTFNHNALEIVVGEFFVLM